MAAMLALIFASCPARAADPDFPALTGRVVDAANLLSAGDAQQIETDLEALENKTTDQLVLVTLPSLQGFPIEDYGYKLGRHWGIGQAGKDNGVLLIVAPKERKVRIEVGRRLEGELTDALTKIIIENAIIPRFRANDYPGGIKAGLNDIVAVLTGDAEAVKLRSQTRYDGDERMITIFIVLVWMFIFAIVLWSIIRSIRQGVTGSKGSKGSNWTFGSGGSSGGGWSSGGGGFSGGGGSFGGGGSSGSW